VSASERRRLVRKCAPGRIRRRLGGHAPDVGNGFGNYDVSGARLRKRAEVRAVRPDAASLLADLLGHPSVVLGELDAATADQVDQLLLTANVFDALAAHVVYVARRRGWPALTADPARLQRVNPDVAVDLL
jgi:hypothetical protein